MMKTTNRFCFLTVFIFALAIIAVMPGLLSAQDVSEDFESYAVDSVFPPDGGTAVWNTWSEDFAGAPQEFGTISDVQAHSGSNSLFEVADNDIVAHFTDVNSGTWEVKAYYFVPADATGTVYFIMMNDFDIPGNVFNWAYQMNMNCDKGQVTDGSGTGLPLVKGEWIEVRAVIDLDQNIQTNYYNGQLMSATRNFAGAGTTVQLQAIDLYSGASAAYIDDLTVTEITPETPPLWAGVLIGNQDGYLTKDNGDYHGVGVTGDVADCDNPLVVSGTGGDIWGGCSSFYYAYNTQEKVGDFDAKVLIKDFTSQDGGNAGEWARAGFMVRQSLDCNSAVQFIGVNERGYPASNAQHQLLHIFRDFTGAGIGDIRQPDFSLPLWVRLVRVGNVFTSYYKYPADADWTLFGVHQSDLGCEPVYFGFGVQNHGQNKGRPAYDATFCGLEITKGIVSTSVTLTSAIPTPTGDLDLGWSTKCPAGLDHYVLKKTDDAGTVTLADDIAADVNTFTDTTDTTGLVATYAITPYGDTGPIGPAGTLTYNSNMMTPDGWITTWIHSPHLNQTGGAQPADDAMRGDYLANADNTVNESNILPIPGTTFEPDFSDPAADPPVVGNALSTGCNAACPNCDPTPTFILAQNFTDGFIDFNSIYGDINDVMTYMVTYITNNTASDLLLGLEMRSDDSHILLIDNTEWNFYKGCCGNGGSAILSPGEHRIMYKVFEGGGGHNGAVRVYNGTTGLPFTNGEVSISPYTTMTEVPESLTPPTGMAFDGNITSWLLLGRYNEGGGCGPNGEFMLQDFLTEGEGGVTEADILPYAGMQVATDYTVAASTGCAGCPNSGGTCDPLTVVKVNGSVIDLEATCSGVDNVMTYMFCYVENKTTETMIAELRCGSDDSMTVLLDNAPVHIMSACRGVTANGDSEPIVITPGVHRLVVKSFEGGGGSGAQASLRDFITKVPYSTDQIACYTPETVDDVPMDTVLPAPTTTVTRSIACDANEGDTFTVTLTIDPPDSPVTIGEVIMPDWAEPTNITGPGAWIPEIRQIQWGGATGSVSYDLVAASGAPNIVGLAIAPDGNNIQINGKTNILVTTPVGDWSTTDFGNPGQPGSTTADALALTVTGSGGDIWGTSDQFQYAYQEIQADNFLMQAVVQSFSGSSNVWAKAGLMFRDTCTANSSHRSIITRQDRHIHMQGRPSQGANSEGQDLVTSDPQPDFPVMLRLVKQGDNVTGYTATWDPINASWNDWTVGSPVVLADEDGTGMFYAGLAVTAHDNNQSATAVFTNIFMTSEINPPTVTLSADPTALDLCSDTVTFSVTATTDDPDGDPVTVQWAAPPGITLDFTNGDLNPNVTANAVGTYDITCTASDGILTSTTSTITLTVNECPNNPPTVGLAVDVDTADLCGDSVAFNFTATPDDPDAGDTVTVTYEVLNATNPDAVTLVPAADGLTAVATATDVGSFDVHCVATDSFNETAEATVTVTVNACPGDYVFVGDGNCDGKLDLADAISTLNYLFAGQAPCCALNMNTNGDTKLDLGDAINLLNFLFAGGTLDEPNKTGVIASGDQGCHLYMLSDIPDIPCDTKCNSGE